MSAIKLYQSFDPELAEEAALKINKDGHNEVEEIAIFINQSRRLVMASAASPKYNKKMESRPFSLVGVYGKGISPEELEEDFTEAMEVFEENMRVRNLISRTGGQAKSPQKQISCANN